MEEEMSGEILTKEEKGVIGKNAFRITIALMAIILYMGAFFTVDSGEVAVVTKFGKVECCQEVKQKKF